MRHNLNQKEFVFYQNFRHFLCKEDNICYFRFAFLVLQAISGKGSTPLERKFFPFIIKSFQKGALKANIHSILNVTLLLY